MSSREQKRERGRALRTELLGKGVGSTGADQEEVVPGFRALSEELIFGGIWDRPGLAPRDRMICTLAALGATERLPQLRHYIPAALDLGLTPRAIVEVLLQSGLYAGFPATENTAAVAAAVFAERNVTVAGDPDPAASAEELRGRGDAMLERLHGARGRQGYAAPDNPVTGALYANAIDYGYGVLWYRPGLETRERALCAVAAFTALRLVDQVAKFGQSALNVGVSRAEVREAVIQTAPYSGFPPALNALAALSAVLQDGDSPTADGGS